MDEQSEATASLSSGYTSADPRRAAVATDGPADQGPWGGGARGDGAGKRGPEWAKLRSFALRQLNRFVALEPKVLRGDSAEAIHDMRVASRRLQEVLDLLYPAPQPREIRKLRRKIRRSRRALSEVRNCDVLLTRVHATLARKRTARREAWEAVRDYLAGRREKTATKALRQLSKINLADFYVRLKEHLAGEEGESNAPPISAPTAEAAPQVIAFPDERGAQRLHRRLADSLERDWQAFETRLAETQGDRRSELVHRARIATKRLRYLVEVVHRFQVAGSGEALAWLRKLQGCLGDWHDLDVLEQAMLEMVARRKFLRQHLSTAMEIERLIVRSRAAKRRLEEKYMQITLGSGSPASGSHSRDAGSGEYQRLAHWVAGFRSSPAA